jgi:hypothetical protein
MSGLFNSTILDVAVGLIFVYLLFAIICTTVNEWVAGIFNFRSSNLRSAIEQLLDGQTGNGTDPGQASNAKWFLNEFYAHPIIAGMWNQQKRKKDTKPQTGGQNADSQSQNAQNEPDLAGYPSYLSSRAFATAVMDIVTPGQQGAINFHDLETGIANLPNGDVKKTLLAVIQNADEDIGKAQQNIEAWFDDTMQRVGGWYKRNTQVWTFVIAAALTIGANADTVRIVHILWTNPTVRAKIVASANNPPHPNRSGGTAGSNAAPNSAVNPNSQPASNPPATGGRTVSGGDIGNAGASANGSTENAGSTNDAIAKSPVLTPDERNELADMLGWPNENQRNDYPEAWYIQALGLFLTIVAVSLGAPFWFDLLNKIVNLRNSGQKPKTGQQQAEAESAAK